MNKLYSGIIRAGLLSLFLGTAAVYGQVSEPARGDNPQMPPPEGRGEVLRELGLSRDQAIAIRRINQDRRDGLDQANRKVREANKLLDEAIYADALDETLVKQRVSDLQKAWADAATLRFEKELAIRRVLTPEQLVRFREMRQRFEEIRQTVEENRRQRRQPPPRMDQPGGPNRSRQMLSPAQRKVQ